MSTQADNLRVLAQRMRENLQAQILGEKKATRVITIASGKGGVGKSNFAVNLAIALTDFNQKVMLLDADLGLANVDVILGILPSNNLADVIAENKTIEEIIYLGPQGIKIIPGGSGMHELANLKEWQLEKFLTKLSRLEGQADFLLIDTGAGLSRTVLSFALAADEIIIVTTAEPTAITDAYGFIKTLYQKRYQGKIYVLANRVVSDLDAAAAFNKLSIASGKFLKYKIEFLGSVREDPRVVQAVREQKPFSLRFPLSPASQDVFNVAAKIADQDFKPAINQGMNGFIEKMLKFFK